MIGIYKITNQINQKAYIGQSKNISSRWRAHRTKYQTEDTLLYRAMRKYGIDNFSFEVIEECDIDQLNDKEIFWIEYYNTHNLEKGYNLTDGGQKATKAILTEKEVLEIYELLKTPLSMEEIAKKYSVTYHTISDINTGFTWIHSNMKYPIRERYALVTGNGTNEPKKYYCMDCGVEVSKGSTRCVKCYGNFHRQQRISREELKSLIRTETFVQIGKKFNVSDNAVRKWCKTFNLPFRKKDINSYTDEEWEKL